jgi:hypothetical protein
MIGSGFLVRLVPPAREDRIADVNLFVVCLGVRKAQQTG